MPSFMSIRHEMTKLCSKQGNEQNPPAQQDRHMPYGMDDPLIHPLYKKGHKCVKYTLMVTCPSCIDFPLIVSDI